MARVSGAVQERYAEHNQVVFSGQARTQQIAYRDQDEARRQELVPLNTSKKYVFRTMPGFDRTFGVRIPTRQFFDDPRVDERSKMKFDRAMDREFGENRDFDFESIRLKVGSDWINFSPIPGNQSRQQQSYYETDDDETARFLLYLKANDRTGKWQHVTVEYPTRTFTIGGQEFPATDAGWEAARAAAIQGLGNEQANGE